MCVSHVVVREDVCFTCCSESKYQMLQGVKVSHVVGSQGITYCRESRYHIL